MSAIGQTEARYVNYIFEPWAQGIGWTLVIIPIALIVITAIVQVFRHDVSSSFPVNMFVLYKMA